MTVPHPPRLFPLFLKLEGRLVLVVGAGPIAERKVLSLIESGARVLVVAPEATDGIAQLAAAGRVSFAKRGFQDADLEGASLAFAATSDPAVQEAVSRAAGTRGIFVVAVDDPPNATAYCGAVVDRPPFLVAISSSGTAPALSRLLREIVEEVLPGGDVIAQAQRLRERWRAEGRPMGERFDELVKEISTRR